ncbi:MAG: lipocalin-like domain-containing protein [Planctomycetota bacterium]
MTGPIHNGARRAVTLLAILTPLGCGNHQDSDGSRLRVAEALRAQGVSLTGFRKADRPRDFVFPADHGPHEDFRSEWWYWTGNLSAEDGRRFGFHFTIFRTALAPDSDRDRENDSAFRTSQLYMAHFALADIANDAVYDAERFARGAGGLAGSRSAPFRVHVEDWEAIDLEEAARSGESIRLRAEDSEDGIAFGLDLELESLRGIVLQGDDGLSKKSSTGDAASYYYSIPRMAVHGDVRIDGDTVPVNGSAWFDREWSTSALDRDQVGWDWFALQLDDERELMFYRLRRTDGSMDPISQGVLVSNDRVRRLSADEVELTAERFWESSETEARYPIEWTLRVPEEKLELRIEAAIEDQELDLSFRYWEGAVRISGSSNGVGYLEMTGYADR